MDVAAYRIVGMDNPNKFVKLIPFSLNSVKNDNDPKKDIIESDESTSSDENINDTYIEDNKKIENINNTSFDYSNNDSNAIEENSINEKINDTNSDDKTSNEFKILYKLPKNAKKINSNMGNFSKDVIIKFKKFLKYLKKKNMCLILV